MKKLTTLLLLSLFLSGFIFKRKERFYQPGILLNHEVRQVQRTVYRTYNNYNPRCYPRNRRPRRVGKRWQTNNRRFNRYNRYRSTYTVPTTVTDRYLSFWIEHGPYVYETNYRPGLFRSYEPTQVIGSAINVRLNNEGDRLYIRKADGREVKTTIVKTYDKHYWRANNPQILTWSQ